MNKERFSRTKSVVATSALALVVAAATFGIASLVVGSRNDPERLGFNLTSGSAFGITSTLFTTPSGAYPTASCSGTPALLYPGLTRCVVFSVHNNLKATISVTGITTSLDTTNYPAPPADCTGTNLVLPTFSGSFNVSGGASGNSPGVPIQLKDNGAPQNDCKNLTYHFIYSGTATYTEVYGTATVVSSSQNPSTTGQSVTYTATVTASATSSQDPVPSSPTGSVTFKDNGTMICTAVPVTSTGTTTATAQCTVSYPTTAGSPHPITAAYANTDGNFTGSSGSLSQTVNASLFGTSTALTSSPNPSLQGQAVTLAATVTKTSGTGTPTGTVTFHLGSPTGTVVGTGKINASGVTSTTSSSLPAGTDNLYAVYSGDTHFSGSSSPVRVQTVIGLPAKCTSSYPNFFYGNPLLPVIVGTNDNDFIYAFGASYLINGLNGNDCIDAGDGNNVITDGNGADAVIAGNGANIVTVGNGTDSVTAGNGNNTIIAGNGTDTVIAGNGTNTIKVGNGADVVIVGNGSHNALFVGGATGGPDTVTIGTGSFNTLTLGAGNDTVTVATPGSHDIITGGSGNETIYLGGGTSNTFHGGKGKNVCHLPTPPVSWHGTAAGYYNDTITNCTVVTP